MLFHVFFSLAWNSLSLKSANSTSRFSSNDSSFVKLFLMASLLRIKALLFIELYSILTNFS